MNTPLAGIASLAALYILYRIGAATMTTPTEQYGPRDIKPQNFATTCDTDGKHVAVEPAAVLRMQRNGWPGPKIASHFKMKPTSLVDQLNKALDDETEAVKFKTPTLSATDAAKGIRL